MPACSLSSVCACQPIRWSRCLSGFGSFERWHQASGRAGSRGSHSVKGGGGGAVCVACCSVPWGNMCLCASLISFCLFSDRHRIQGWRSGATLQVLKGKVAQCDCHAPVPQLSANHNSALVLLGFDTIICQSQKPQIDNSAAMASFLFFFNGIRFEVNGAEIRQILVLCLQVQSRVWNWNKMCAKILLRYNSTCCRVALAWIHQTHQIPHTQRHQSH